MSADQSAGFGGGADFSSRPPLQPPAPPQITLPRPTHRPREEVRPELEAGAELKLGEFQDVPTLSLSEARLVINKVLDLRRSAAAG
ncbi:hypothetical protein KEM52_002767, partial [Ascosphaera acerosa]